MTEAPLETLSVGVSHGTGLLMAAAGIAGAVVAVFCVLGLIRPKH